MTHAHALAAAAGPTLVTVPEAEFNRLVKVDCAARAYMAADSQKGRAAALVDLMQAADDLEYLIASVVEVGPNRWSVVSRTSGKRWTVAYDTEGGYWCPCPGASYRGTCGHVRAVSEWNRRAAIERTDAAE